MAWAGGGVDGVDGWTHGPLFLEGRAQGWVPQCRAEELADGALVDHEAR